MPTDPRHGVRPQDLGQAPPGAWRCPSCQSMNGTPMEDGCRFCGVGTAEERQQAEQTRAAQTLTRVPDGLLVDETTRVRDDAGRRDLTGFTPAARLTIARALAVYAETTVPSDQELTRQQTLSWAREIAAALDAE